MIRTFCGACDAEIEVPQAGWNVCPACGLDTHCFGAAEPTFTLAELQQGQVAAMAYCFPRAWRRGFGWGLALAAAISALCNTYARYWP